MLGKCYFNYDTLIAKVGIKRTGYEELKCIQVPPFVGVTFEKECEGNGWYSVNKVRIERTYDKYYVIIKDDKPFGVLYHPYHQDHHIKSEIHSIDSKHPFPQIKEFLNILNK